MASPGVFLSSPLRRSKQYIVPSSSPDLPSIQDLLPQKASRPAIENRNKTTTIPDTATSTSSGARDLGKSAQAATVSQINALQRSNPVIVIEDSDPATTTIEPASDNKTPPRRRRRFNEKVEAIGQHTTYQETQAEEALETTQQPWKRFKPKSPEKDAVEASAKPDPFRKNSISPVPDTALGDDTKRTCSPMQDSLLSPHSRARPWDAEDSLQLEPAMTRRKDWTPPKQTATCGDAPESSAATGSVQLGSDAKKTSFETLLTAYKCSDSAIDDSASHQSDGSASKKRRLTGVQPVQTTLAPPIPIASTVVAKKKAPRKKPRTITALATAAYKQATQVECEDASAREKNSLPLPHPQQAAAQNKAKVKPPKRPTNPKKKKILPPKPILFSPETALKQVAQQDFVFGTSSQLAEEQSPTFLRDLQRAMKSSNQLDEVLYSTPLNSDSVEPLDCRPKLWDAAARDADGDLFDVEVINLTEGNASAPPTPGEDPFGYCKGDIGPSPPLPRAAEEAIDEPARDDDEFVDLSDILQASPTAPGPPPETLGVGRFLSSCPPSPEYQGGLHSAVPVVGDEDLETGMSSQPQSVVQSSAMPVSAPMASHVTRPAFENYTDAQLSTEVSRYGFKPIKRRSAMVALLEQCWQQRMDHIGPHARMLSTAAPASKPTVSSPTKRPRGRPRKDSDPMKICQAQDPPPSAQVPETPKRRRGRPRKDEETSPSIAKVSKKKTTSKRKATPTKATPTEATSTKATPTKATPKKTTLEKATPKKATPKKAKKDAKVVEIADSESELADTLGASPSSSCSTSSSRQQDIDLTTSLGQDTELSLAMTSEESESNIFEFITRAITTAPRTTVPSEPSWHEKILLYDPIVLEDLTRWLNGGQLTRVGCDEETDPAEVKKWCESKSICCLWKVNLRGKERRRF
ncbi:hypothetical protein E4U53_001228 [Claviceps sorghi]|nr:hypothetical protein E4U53_001228 [Claviceps sorghi]